MKKIVAFFTNSAVLSIIGLTAISLLIWFMGAAIKFGEDNVSPLASETSRLLTIIIVIVIWGLNNLRLRAQENKNNSELVDDLQNAQAEENNLINDQTSGELQQMGERFSQALATLKKLKFKGKNSKKALYELPWYIIIGPPGSGKTTALINSSLDFPLADQFGKGALKGVGGTRSCDWWFTNEAVLIDTAGRYTTQDSHKVIDSSAWEGFLNLLKKHRRRRPINGAIIAISLQQLLTQSEEERIKHANTIRNRIDELMEKLEIRFPVYLMFTKCDLVSGFSEFFEDLNKDDREQVWGISLPNAPQQTESPDFSALSGEYRNMIKRLYDRVLWRVHQERDVKRRAAIQGFPLQMENLDSIINQFVQQTFIKNRYRFQPYLRGVYFTSGTQDGTPIDRLMSSVAVSYGFSRDAVTPALQQGKSYFLGQLFRDVIFPESELVGSNLKYEKIIKWGKRTAYAGMAAIIATMSIIWADSFVRNEGYMQQVAAHVEEYKTAKVKYNALSSNIQTTLPTLNALAQASQVYDQEAHPWLSTLGMYDSNVDDAANSAYHTQLKQLFQPKLVSYIERHLSRGHGGGDLYNSFRTYVMFNKLEHMDRQLVLNWFTERWAKEFEGEATKRKALTAHLTTLLSLELEPAKLNPRMLSSTRNLLLRVPTAQRAYQRIRTDPTYTQKFDLLNEFGESVRKTYVTTPAVLNALSIPVLFTKEGYDAIDFSPESNVIASIVNEKWLFSDSEDAKVDFIKDDLDEVSKKVKEHYLAEYKTHWEKVYDALAINQLKDLSHANDVLNYFIDPVYSPLLSILHTASNHTQLTNPLVADLADDHQQGTSGKIAALAASKTDWTKVDKAFRELNVMLRESSKNPAPVNAVLLKISELQAFVNEIALAPDPAKKSFEIAKSRYQNGTGNAISSLQAFANKSPEPIQRWLNSLANETWKVILQAAHQHINAEWKTNVYQPYRQGLANRYPLKTSADDELALHDFVAFFKPGGTIDAFHQAYVKPFISTRNGWKNRAIDGHHLGLSQKTINQIRKALSIKNIYFRNNAEIPSLTFQLKPHTMAKTDARFILELGEKRIAYSHGPKLWKTLSWAGDDEHNRVRIIFEDLDEVQHSTTFEGPWAWFRLLSQSTLVKTEKSNVYLVTYSMTNTVKQTDAPGTRVKHQITYQIKAKSVNNPFNNNLLSSFRCPETI